MKLIKYLMIFIEYNMKPGSAVVVASAFNCYRLFKNVVIMLNALSHDNTYQRKIKEIELAQKRRRDKYFKDSEQMTATILLLIVIFAIVLSVFAIYFYDKKLMKEIAEYEERMKNKGYFKRHFIKDKK